MSQISNANACGYEHGTVDHLAAAETMLQDGLCPMCAQQRIAELERVIEEMTRERGALLEFVQAWDAWAADPEGPTSLYDRVEEKRRALGDVT